jgi:CBS domain-containing protein
MFVRELMSSPAVTIGPTDEVADAARILDRLSLTSLPVVDADRRLLGVIGEGDVIGQLATSVPPGQSTDAPARAARVRDVMARQVVTIAADDDICEVVTIMIGSSVKSLPVLLHDRVVGVVSRRDLVRAMAQGELRVVSPTAPASR